MSVIDIVARVDAICKKYEKFDVEKQTDAFARLHLLIEADIEAAQQKAEVASMEESRASSDAVNAEIRRSKGRLREEVLKLQRLAMEKVKRLSPEELAARNDLVLALADRIQGIRDGTGPAPNWNEGWAASASKAGNGNPDNEYIQQTEESSQLEQHFRMWKMKRVMQLAWDYPLVLDDLKNTAPVTNEDVNGQVPMMVEIDCKVRISIFSCVRVHKAELTMLSNLRHTVIG